MIPHDDRGLTLGDGLFETILCEDGALDALPEHLDRLARGCAAVGLPAPDLSQARTLCEEAAATVPGRAAVRLTLTAGSGGRGLDRPRSHGSIEGPRLFATAAPAPKPATPATLATVSIRRNEGSPASRLKTLSYLDNVLARREAGADEALMLNNAGEVACAAAANVFWITGGRLYTPALACGVLDGIMRARVMAAVPAEQVRAPRSVLDEAEAVFLTNSLIGVRAVARLDGRALGPHPMVAALSSSS